MQAQYVQLLELARQPQPSPLSSPPPAAAAVQVMAEVEATVAELQQGIRTKHAQTSRIVLLNALRREVAERRQCVAKMEGVLSASRQHVRL